MPALVPSMVESALVALRDYGTKSFNEVVRARHRIRRRLAIDEMRAGTHRAARAASSISGRIRRSSSCRNGQVPMPGEIFHQPDLARTLRSMAEAEKKALAAGATRAAAIDAVRDYFYRGEIAQRIDAFMRPTTA